MQERRGIVYIIIAACMFGSYGVWSRLIGPEFGTFFQGWSRGLIIAILLLPILMWQKQIVPIARSDWRWLGLFLLATSLTQAPLFYAFNHMDIGSASLLFYVGMLLTMYLVGLLFLGEGFTATKLVSLFIAAIGMYAVFSFSLIAFSLLAALMAVLNGVASGAEVSFSKKLSGDYSPLYLSWLSWIIICVTNAPVSILLGESQHLPSLSMVWLYQLGYVITSILGFWLIIKGLKYAEASIGGLLGLLEIVVGVGLGIWLFGEDLSAHIIFGGALIILAAAIPHIVELFSESKSSPGT